MDHTNRTIHNAFLERARRNAPEITHPAPETALRYGLFSVNAAAREAILSGALRTYDVADDKENLVAELTGCVYAYLGARPSQPV